MYKRIFLVIAVLFCCNTLLSLFSSCRERGNTEYKSRCSVPSCFISGAASVKAFEGVTHKPLVAPAYEVKATDLVLQILIEGNTSVCKAVKPRQNLSLFSTANAYAAPEPCFIKQGGDSILSYNIYSNADYDAAHPAGSSLNDIITTDDIPSKPFYGQYTSNAIMVLDLMVDSAPTGTGNHIFTIVLTQKDGETITVTTPSMRLLN